MNTFRLSGKFDFYLSIAHDKGLCALVKRCNDKRIDGAVKMGNTWLIPKDANKPADGRYKMNKEKQLGTKGDLLDE